MRFLHLPFLFFITLTSQFSGLAQQSGHPPVGPPTRIRFEHLTVADGLPENSVISMLQDHLGYMWLGTQNGLVRYDGTNMVVFQYDNKNPYSFQGKRIRALHEDKNGDIWIGTEGLFRFERATGRFINYTQKSPEPVKKSDLVGLVHEDKQGNIWTITYRKALQGYVLDRLNPKTRAWTYLRPNPKNTHSLASNDIYHSYENGMHDFSFIEDKKGIIWVTTRGEKENTLHWFDQTSDQFIRFNPITTPAIAADFKKITTIAVDNKGGLYLSSFVDGKGLFYVNPKNGQVAQFKHDPKNHNSLRCDSLTNVHQSRDGIIWITTRQGLDRFDPKTGVFTHILSKPNDPTSPSPGLLNFLYEMPDGNLWFVASNGLNFYDRRTNQFLRYENRLDQEEGLLAGNNFNGIRSFWMDKTGLVWVGSWLGGLNKQNRRPQFPSLTSDPRNSNSLQNSLVATIYEAPSEPSVIWFGTPTGLDRLDKKTGTYTHYQYDSLDTHSLGKGTVGAITEDKKGRFWVGTWESGLYLMNRKTGQFTRFSPNRSNPNQSAFTYINYLLPASDGTLWVSNLVEVDHVDIDQNKLTYYYPADSTYTPDLFALLNRIAIPAHRIASIEHPGNNVNKTTPFTLAQPTDLCIVAAGNLTATSKDDYGWIEDLTGKVVWEMSYKQSRSDGYQTMRVQTQTLRLAAGSYRLRFKSDKEFSYGAWPATPPYHPELWGIQLVQITDPQRQLINRLVRQKYQRAGLSHTTIYFLREDSRKQIWIGSDGGGLSRFDPATGQFTIYSDFLKGPWIVQTLLEDRKTGNVWVGDYGFGLLLLDRNGTIRKRYTMADGLPSNAVSGIQEDAKGYLWISTDNNGLCRFDPRTEQFRRFNLSNGLQDLRFFNTIGSFKTSDGEIYFAGAKGVVAFYPTQIQDDPYPPRVIVSDLSIQGKPATVGIGQQVPVHISVAKEISLPHDQNDLTFQFAAISYSRGSESRYAYQLTPIDKDWVQNGTIRRARYSDLKPGTYIFRVKAANADGVWNEKGTSIQVTIRPPWWQTWWAYCFYALVLASILRAYIAYRSRALRRENQLLEEKVAQRTNEVQQQKEEIESQRDHLEDTLTELKSTQDQLIQKEKLASLGELTAGIAHEIQNPLNFVNNFSEVSTELIEELKQEAQAGNTDEVMAIADDLTSNLQKINHHGGRASSIVKGMLEHSRTESGDKQPTNLNALADEYLKIAYHGLKAKDMLFNCELVTDFDNTVGKVNLIPQDMGRVLLNLYNNAFYAVNERVKQRTDANVNYQPRIEVSTQRSESDVIIRISDNGTGFPDSVKVKIFQPFFTTKPTGEGTGLGLSLSYDIITKGHGGTLSVDSTENKGTLFTITLPL
ncbi:sensor histidine kinase [Spirosoma migulaei]